MRPPFWGVYNLRCLAVPVSHISWPLVMTHVITYYTPFARCIIGRCTQTRCTVSPFVLMHSLFGGKDRGGCFFEGVGSVRACAFRKD